MLATGFMLTLPCLGKNLAAFCRKPQMMSNKYLCMHREAANESYGERDALCSPTLQQVVFDLLCCASSIYELVLAVTSARDIELHSECSWQRTLALPCRACSLMYTREHERRHWRRDMRPPNQQQCSRTQPSKGCKAASTCCRRGAHGTLSLIHI